MESKVLVEHQKEDSLLYLKRRRAGLLGEVSKRMKLLAEALTSKVDSLKVEELHRNYDEAFRKFVRTHDVCMLREPDEEKKSLMQSGYMSHIELKNTLDSQVARYKAEPSRDDASGIEGSRQRETGTNVEKSSCASRTSVGRSSVRAGQKLQQKRLDLELLRRKQEIQQQLDDEEERLRRCAELECKSRERQRQKRRELELLEAENAVWKAEVALTLSSKGSSSMSMVTWDHLSDEEQSVHMKTDNVQKSNPSENWRFVPYPQMFNEEDSLPRTEPPQPVRPEVDRLQRSQFPQFPRPEVDRLQRSQFPQSSRPEVDRLQRSHLPQFSRPVVDRLQRSRLPQSSRPEVDRSEQSRFPQFSRSEADRFERSQFTQFPRLEVNRPQWSQIQQSPISEVNRLQGYRIPKMSSRNVEDFQWDNTEADGLYNPRLHQEFKSERSDQEERKQSHTIEPWQAVAEALRQGSSVPKLELVKFGGDPLDFAVFRSNFKSNIEDQVSKNSLRLSHLIANCTGKAREVIRGCVSLSEDEGYSKAWEALFWNFGRPHMVAEAHLKRLFETHVRRDTNSLLEFARKLEEVGRSLKSLGPSFHSRLENEENIVNLMKKLPDDSLKRKWVEHAGDLILTKGAAEYEDFCKFVRRSADRLNNRFGRELKIQFSDDKKSQASKPQNAKVTTLATVSSGNTECQTSERPKRRGCPQCSQGHAVWMCKKFRSASVKDRFKVVRQHKLCRRCLDFDHFANDCPKGFVCKKPGCGKDHNSLLHYDAVKEKQERAEENHIDQGNVQRPADPIVSSSQVSSSSSASVIQTKRPRVCFKIVPVKVINRVNGKEKVVYAFLDNGSDSTICLESMAKDLDLDHGHSTNLTLSTISGKENLSYFVVSLDVQGFDGGEVFSLDPVLTTKKLPVSQSHIADKRDVERFPHLHDVKLAEVSQDVEVSLLIGSDRPDIIENELDKRLGKRGEPYAVQTPLGWTVYGPLLEDQSIELSSVGFARFQHDRHLSSYLQSIDSDSMQELGWSLEDKKADEIMEHSAQLVHGHYQIKLPFRQMSPTFPDNLSLARKRLWLLKKRFEWDPELMKRYTEVLQRYHEEGALKCVSEEEVASLKEKKEIWYLPHHAVWQEKKPDPRVVFDCAAQYDGTSLNDELMQGPDNTNRLLGVILRFRVGNVAVTADVKRMFHQVLVAPEDRGALCLLWWPNGDLTKDAQTYQMMVHIFGAKSSPSVASFALRRTARDNADSYSSDIVEAVHRDFYVDDFLKSFEDEIEAVSKSKQIAHLLKKGGFTLTKWLSTSRTVMSEFPIEDHSASVKDLDLKTETLPIDKALGIQWNIENDSFQLVVKKKMYPENRKGVLASIAGVYDPLGFASPLVLPGRLINQHLCGNKYDWKDELPPQILSVWKEWREGLESMQDYQIPRCFKPKGFGNISRAELHHFADASQELGYGAVSYLRISNNAGQVHVSFVMGKSRVKPLRSTMTVPKLELTAATLLVEINNMIVKELDGRIAIDSVTYWTDSLIVLRYIWNTKKRFVTFVANRVNTILQNSLPSQWRHVRSEANPADHASRGLKPSDVDKLRVWRLGPDFLWKDPSEWPIQPQDVTVELLDSEEGVKKEKGAIFCAISTKEDFWGNIFRNFSSWIKLLRCVAWLFRAVKCFTACTSLKKTSFLSLNELDDAERGIISEVQCESFPDEFSTPSRGKGRTSRLASLQAYREDRCLRVGGRLQRSCLSYDEKHPFILPGNHPVTNLIVKHYHIENGHVGVHQVLALTRRKFWIIKGVSSVRRVLRKCHECRRASSRPGEQITAPLPEVRCVSDVHKLVHPFAAVGIDYFGPLNVKSRRSTVKRYGCIFTCLRYRAVHLEVAIDLSTDSFIAAMLRFIARRGPPSIVFSDNGTNFRGAEADVLEALKAFNHEKIRRFLQNKHADWIFNPPAASHQGGVWERLIRSVRRILQSLVGNRLVDEETLSTFLAEVEKIMNDGPITRVSSDPRDLEALTPSHILLLRRNPSVPPCEFNESDRYRLRWKQANLLAEEFWQRWIREYLPTLQERQKWLRSCPNFKRGDLVLIMDKSVPKGSWPKAIVQEAFPDKDGVVRRVRVSTATGEYLRDVRSLCMLEEDIIHVYESQSIEDNLKTS